MPVMIKLKWGMEYKGTLQSVDSYMNVLVSVLLLLVLGIALGSGQRKCENIFKKIFRFEARKNWNFGAGVGVN